jgi:hypothetical protein
MDCQYLDCFNIVRNGSVIELILMEESELLNEKSLGSKLKLTI